MRLMLLTMISNSSLSAFSGATASGPLNRVPGVQPARLLRGDQPAGPVRAGPQAGMPPKGPMPRGSLLNLSV